MQAIKQLGCLHMSDEEDDSKKDVKGKAKGGVARAKSLTKERRSEIAKKAAIKRWGNRPPKAIHKGNFKDQFNIDAECYILDDADKTVVVSKTGLSKLLGIGEHGRDIDRLLKTNYMAEFVDPELLEKIEKPLIFQWRSTVPKSEVEGAFFDSAHGYDITLIGDVATALIKADMAGSLPSSRKKSAALAQQLVTASMKLGLKGLGYAIAGYRPEVQEVIDAFKAFVREEARQYEKEFPDELYEAWYKIYQLNKPERGRPFLFSKLTNEQIYIPLAKSNGKILDLARKNKDENGKKGDKIHQFLAEVGVKALKQQIGKVLAVSELFDDKESYEAALMKVNKA